MTVNARTIILSLIFFALFIYIISFFIKNRLWSKNNIHIDCNKIIFEYAFNKNSNSFPIVQSRENLLKRNSGPDLCKEIYEISDEIYCVQDICERGIYF